jgi:hypothetical protein
MVGGNLADRPRTRTHDQRLGIATEAVEPHTLQEIAIGDTRGRKEAVVAPYEVVGGEYAAQVVAGINGRSPFMFVAGPQTAQLFTAHTFQRGRSDHALGRTADAEQDVGAGLRPCGGDCAGDVAIGDQTNSGAGGPHLRNDLLVTGAVENHRGEVAY